MSNEAIPYAPGDVVDGKYRIDAVIGVGGMGVVARGMHLVLGEPVALKFLRADREADSVIHERFLQEGRIAARLKGERLVRVLDAARSAEGFVYLVMECLEGEDLGRRLAREGPFDPVEAAWLGVQMCEALSPAHERGVVHRDIKPSNLFLLAGAEPDRCLKLLDFGISKVLADANADCGLTSSSASLGSPLYMSPEQMQAPGSVDERTDIWSVGAVLHEVLTGASPFRSESLPGTVARILSADATPVNVPGGDGRAWRALLARCLAKDPEDRYQDVRELGRALVPLCGSRAAAAAERVDRLLASRSLDGVSADTTTAGWTAHRGTSAAQGRWGLWLGGLLAVGLGGALVVSLPRLREAPPERGVHHDAPAEAVGERVEPARQPVEPAAAPVSIEPKSVVADGAEPLPPPTSSGARHPRRRAVTPPPKPTAPTSASPASSPPAPRSKSELVQEALSSRY